MRGEEVKEVVVFVESMEVCKLISGEDKSRLVALSGEISGLFLFWSNIIHELLRRKQRQTKKKKNREEIR